MQTLPKVSLAEPGFKCFRCGRFASKEDFEDSALFYAVARDPAICELCLRSLSDRRIAWEPWVQQEREKRERDLK